MISTFGKIQGTEENLLAVHGQETECCFHERKESAKS